MKMLPAIVALLIAGCDSSSPELSSEEKSVGIMRLVLAKPSKFGEEAIVRIFKNRSGKSVGIMRLVFTRANNLVEEVIVRISKSESYSDISNLLTELHEGVDRVRRQYKDGYLKNLNFIEENGIDKATFERVVQEKYDAWAQATLDSFDRSLAVNKIYTDEKTFKQAVEKAKQAGEEPPSRHIPSGVWGIDIDSIHKHVAALRARIGESLHPMENMRRAPLKIKISNYPDPM